MGIPHASLPKGEAGDHGGNAPLLTSPNAPQNSQQGGAGGGQGGREGDRHGPGGCRAAGGCRVGLDLKRWGGGVEQGWIQSGRGGGGGVSQPLSGGEEGAGRVSPDQDPEWWVGGMELDAGLRP